MMSSLKKSSIKFAGRVPSPRFNGERVRVRGLGLWPGRRLDDGLVGAVDVMVITGPSPSPRPSPRRGERERAPPRHGTSRTAPLAALVVIAA